MVTKENALESLNAEINYRLIKEDIIKHLPDDIEFTHFSENTKNMSIMMDEKNFRLFDREMVRGKADVTIFGGTVLYTISGITIFASLASPEVKDVILPEGLFLQLSR